MYDSSYFYIINEEFSYIYIQEQTKSADRVSFTWSVKEFTWLWWFIVGDILWFLWISGLQGGHCQFSGLSAQNSLINILDHRRINMPIFTAYIFRQGSKHVITPTSIFVWSSVANLMFKVVLSYCMRKQL